MYPVTLQLVYILSSIIHQTPHYACLIKCEYVRKNYNPFERKK